MSRRLILGLVLGSLLTPACLGTLGSHDAGTDASPDASDDASDASAPGDASVSLDASVAVDASVSLDASVLPRWSIDGGLSFTGAFRLDPSAGGVSSVDYAVGTLGVNPVKNSLFVAGHAQQNAIAEFAIPTPGMASTVAALPVASALQPFAFVLDAAPSGNPQGVDRITGLLWEEGHLLINAEVWYDASGKASDTTLVVRDADHLTGAVDGYFALEGSAHAAGYMGPLPAPWAARLGATHYTGWASNYSIVSRYSVGPTLFTFEPRDLLGADAGARGPISTSSKLEYPFDGHHTLGPDALSAVPGQAPALWNFLSKGMYGFVVPGTRTFAVFGATGGVHSGIGYKITQDDGTLCGGYCAYSAGDYSNAYWLFDLDEILSAAHPWDPLPYEYGPLSHPFDAQGKHGVIGGSFDPERGLLYLALANAGQVGTYDRPPLVLVYEIR